MHTILDQVVDEGRKPAAAPEINGGQYCGIPSKRSSIAHDFLKGISEWHFLDVNRDTLII
jgi:hypothetical protein